MLTQRRKDGVGDDPGFRHYGVSRNADSGEAAILRLVSEQLGLSVPQLASLLGVSVNEVDRRVKGLEDLGWIRVVRVAGSRDEWIWLRHAGAVRSGTGFLHRQTTVGCHEHRSAINEVRVLMSKEHPDARWVCERQLRSEVVVDGCIPDGLLIVDGRRWAIEVELSRKPLPALRRALKERIDRYDRVLYFCSTQVGTLVKELSDEVDVRELPDACVRKPVKVVSRCKEDPTSGEVAELTLVSEEGIVAVSELGPLLGVSVKAGEDVADRLVAKSFVRRGYEVDGDGGWIWCSGRKDRAGTGLSGYRPAGVGTLQARLALLRVRVDVQRRFPDVVWSTRRKLVRGLPGPRRSDLPSAVAEIEGRKCAIEVVPVGQPRWRAVQRLEGWLGHYDEVWCYVPSELEAGLRAVAKKRSWSSVMVSGWL